MKISNCLLLFLFCTTMLTSCTKKKTYSKDVFEKETLGVKFQLLPLLEKTKQNSDAEFFALRLSYANQIGSVLDYGSTAQQNMHSLNLRYLSFEFQKDIKLKVNGETYPCTFYNFERTYGLTPYATAVIAFDTKKKKGKKKILLSPKFMNVGVIPFEISN